MSDITGRGWAFPLYLDDRQRIAMVEDDADIRQSIFIILNTFPGERVMRPEFGCRIHELIFWPVNEQTAYVAERYVTEALNRWEPRIRVHEVTATLGDEDWGEIRIEIVYEIKSQRDVRSLIYPFYLTPV